MASYSLLARSAAAAAVLVLLAIPARASAQRTDIIRGRVVAADSTPLRGAIVTATDTAAKVPKPTRTDSAGLYSISFENGGGTYTVSATVLGHAPQRRVVTRNTDGTMPKVDFKMMPVAAQLGAVRSVGERPKPPRSDYGDFSVGGSVTYQSMSNGLSGDVTGDLTSVLATLPGVSVTPSIDGTLNISAFGVGSDQNGLVLNGMNFGAQVPRDGFQLIVVSATYDPGRGGFAGVQQSLRMSPGNNIISRSAHLSLDAPALQWTSQVAGDLGTRYGQQIASGSIGGPIAMDKAFYSTAYQFSRRASSLTTLASADPSALLALHVSPDSVRRLLGLLGQAGIPIRTSRVPSGRENTSGSLAFRFDFEPNVPPPQPGSFFQQNATYDDYYLEFGGTVRDNDGAMTGPTSVPSAGGTLKHRDGWAQFTAAKYLPRNALNETTVSVGGSEDRTEPYLDLPSASVLMASSLDDGGVGISTARVGGALGARSTSTSWLTEVKNATTYNTWNRHHSVALTLDGTFDGYSVQQDASHGSFVFNSLADFSNNAPASYSRTLTGLHTSGTGFNGAIGLGDSYNPVTPGTFQFGQLPPSRPAVQYGVRLEANHFGFQPAYNATVESTFGVRTDHVPNGVRVMPMVGFSWPILGGLKVNGISFGRRGTISGGVREYRGTLSTRAIDAYTRQTGLPSAVQQLYCVGAATPLPDWEAFAQGGASLPAECADGAVSTPLAQTAPPVALLAPDYQVLDSWRPALNVSFAASPKYRFTLSGTLAENRHATGNYDLNFAAAPRFTLPAEGNRPVYVSPTSVVPATGAAAYTESRVSPDFAHVNEARSDLRNEVRSLGLTLNYSPGPILAGPNAGFMFGTVTYTYSDSREQFRGFQSAAGDPRALSWSRGTIAKHQIVLTVNRNQRDVGNFALQARIQSGTPFTPSVAGDINGDGYSNDRAFVIDPAAASTDTASAAAMQRLLGSAPSSIRNCLERQVGKVAGRNSCVGPWSMPQLNLTLSPDPYRFGFRNRGNITLIVSNILGGLDQALHGSNKLHGWGQQAFADPTLLTVRGFDPTAQRFTYTLNPLFGSTSQFRNTFRAPFMLTLDVRLEVGPDRETQVLESLLKPRGSEAAALTLEQVKNRIARAFNPIDQLLMQKDSINLTGPQIDSIRILSRSYSMRRDSIATDMARYLLSRHGDYGGEAVREHWHQAGVSSYRGYIRSVKSVVSLFTPEQMALARTKPSLLGFVTIASFKDDDVSQLFRGAMNSLP